MEHVEQLLGRHAALSLASVAIRKGNAVVATQTVVLDGMLVPRVLLQLLISYCIEVNPNSVAVQILVPYYPVKRQLESQQMASVVFRGEGRPVQALQGQLEGIVVVSQVIAETQRDTAAQVVKKISAIVQPMLPQMANVVD